MDDLNKHQKVMVCELKKKDPEQTRRETAYRNRMRMCRRRNMEKFIREGLAAEKKAQK